MTATTAPVQEVSRHELTRAPFVDLVKAELGKILSQRPQRWLFGIAVLLAPMAAIVFCISLPVTQGKTLGDTATGDVLTASLLGIDAATIAAIVFAAVAVGTEYSTGLMQHSITVTPNRTRLLTAKTIAVASATAVIGVAGVILVGAVAGAAVAGTGRSFVDILGGSGPRLLAGSILMPVFYGVLATLFAFMFRKTAAGILGPIAVLVLAAIIGWFGADISQVLTPLTPLAGLHSISGIASGAEDIGPLSGAITLIVWLLFGYGIARWRFTRKDA
ncbi:ABC-2 type transport system permease protein [Microbacterium natoriense]|uniref:ABC-2 type transport system permease protein n=1 Tax=Microbacterium natoriense TaxID=284570 RepID=A0AAW8EUI2_9MICO|nr:hypothetical protein [Microbacterium natoriense]MDQ0646505.1 ABC-2 type transport system permease protein [Microbacterium natoriense]